MAAIKHPAIDSLVQTALAAGGAHLAIHMLENFGRLSEADDGSWITINGAHVHLNGAGVADKGPSAATHSSGAKSSASRYDRANAEFHAHVSKMGKADYKADGGKAAHVADQKELSRLTGNLRKAIAKGE